MVGITSEGRQANLQRSKTSCFRLEQQNSGGRFHSGYLKYPIRGITFPAIGFRWQQKTNLFSSVKEMQIKD